MQIHGGVLPRMTEQKPQVVTVDLPNGPLVIVVPTESPEDIYKEMENDTSKPNT